MAVCSNWLKSQWLNSVKQGLCPQKQVLLIVIVSWRDTLQKSEMVYSKALFWNHIYCRFTSCGKSRPCCFKKSNRFCTSLLSSAERNITTIPNLCNLHKFKRMLYTFSTSSATIKCLYKQFSTSLKIVASILLPITRKYASDVGLKF